MTGRTKNYNLGGWVDFLVSGVKISTTDDFAKEKA